MICTLTILKIFTKKMKFEEDEYLQKYCSYLKAVKINKIVKNLKNNKKLDSLTDKYKEVILSKVR